MRQRFRVRRALPIKKKEPFSVDGDYFCDWGTYKCLKDYARSDSVNQDLCNAYCNKDKFPTPIFKCGKKGEPCANVSAGTSGGGSMLACMDSGCGLPDFAVYGCNNGQCLPSSTGTLTLSDCQKACGIPVPPPPPPPTPLYVCNSTTGQCVIADDGDPSAMDKQQCENICTQVVPIPPSPSGPIKYACQSDGYVYKCVFSNPGDASYATAYDTSAECIAACHAAPPPPPTGPDRYVCDLSTFQCRIVPYGSPGYINAYDTVEECQDKCVKPAPAGGYTCDNDGQCTFAIWGTDTKAECEAKCTPRPDKYKCNDQYQCVISADGTMDAKTCAQNCVKPPPPGPPGPPSHFPLPGPGDFPSNVSPYKNAVTIANSGNKTTIAVLDEFAAPCLPLPKGSDGKYHTCLPSDSGKCDMNDAKGNIIPGAQYFRTKGTSTVPLGSCDWTKNEATMGIYKKSQNKVVSAPLQNYQVLEPGDIWIIDMPKDDAGRAYWCSDGRGYPNRSCDGVGGWFSPYDPNNPNTFIQSGAATNRFEINPNELDLTAVVNDKGEDVPNPKSVYVNAGQVADQGIFYNSSAVEGVNAAFDMYYTGPTTTGGQPGAAEHCARGSNTNVCDINLAACPPNYRTKVTYGKSPNTWEGWSCVAPKNYGNPGYNFTAFNDESYSGRYFPKDFSVPKDVNKPHDPMYSDFALAGAGYDDEPSKLKAHAWWDYNSLQQNKYAKGYSDYVRPVNADGSVCSQFPNMCQQYVWAYDEKICKYGDCCPVYDDRDPSKPLDVSDITGYVVDNPLSPLRVRPRQDDASYNIQVSNVLPTVSMSSSWPTS